MVEPRAPTVSNRFARARVSGARQASKRTKRHPMPNDLIVINDEPPLPTSYLRRGPATSGELWALDRWREERRLRQKPTATRVVVRVLPFVALAVGVVTSLALRHETDLSLTSGTVGCAVAAIMLGVLIQYERRGYIRLLERYATELHTLRSGGHSDHA